MVYSVYSGNSMCRIDKARSSDLASASFQPYPAFSKGGCKLLGSFGLQIAPTPSRPDETPKPQRHSKALHNTKVGFASLSLHRTLPCCCRLCCLSSMLRHSIYIYIHIYTYFFYFGLSLWKTCSMHPTCVSLSVGGFVRVMKSLSLEGPVDTCRLD